MGCSARLVTQASWNAEEGAQEQPPSRERNSAFPVAARMSPLESHT
ncbi:MAG TPA: hypothetical protein VF697_09710 [Archangium sp.]